MGLDDQFEYDIVFPSPPPIRSYKVKLNIKTIKKGEPQMSLQNEILSIISNCNRCNKPVTADDIIRVFEGKYPRMEVAEAIRLLEFQHKLRWRCITYLEVAK